MIEIVVPQLDLGEVDLRVSCWLVDIGETVIEGDPLLELRWPGFTYELASPATGKLMKILRQIEQPVREGDTLGIIE